jgi:hypothetical protein
MSTMKIFLRLLVPNLLDCVDELCINYQHQASYLPFIPILTILFAKPHFDNPSQIYLVVHLSNLL